MPCKRLACCSSSRPTMLRHWLLKSSMSSATFFRYACISSELDVKPLISAASWSIVLSMLFSLLVLSSSVRCAIMASKPEHCAANLPKASACKFNKTSTDCCWPRAPLACMSCSPTCIAFNSATIFASLSLYSFLSDSREMLRCPRRVVISPLACLLSSCNSVFRAPNSVASFACASTHQFCKACACAKSLLSRASGCSAGTAGILLRSSWSSTLKLFKSLARPASISTHWFCKACTVSSCCCQRALTSTFVWLHCS
mmetsp:Transcript_23345/g.58061  ORF Transcript_23345/g.58061 Transcript_23345/m.58061 type:complete len:257 (-) Transcript_23345:67-837(-)